MADDLEARLTGALADHVKDVEPAPTLAQIIARTDATARSN
jgi:hypothetical protein